MYYEREGIDEPLDYAPWLGELTSEIEDGWILSEVLALGPKNYALYYEHEETKETRTVTKVRGFTLSHEASQALTRDRLKKLVDDFVQFAADNAKISVPCSQIRRSKDFQITSNSTPKQYGICYDKRVIVGKDYRTLPFGY